MTQQFEMKKGKSKMTDNQVVQGIDMGSPCDFIPEGDTVPYHLQVTEGLNCPKCEGTGVLTVKTGETL